MIKQNPRVSIFCNSSWYTHIVVTTDCNSPTYIFTVQYPSGVLFFSNTPKIDVFESQVAARHYIRNKFKSVLISDGVALIGLSIISNKILYSIVQRSKQKLTLPNGAIVYKTKEIDTFSIDLKSMKQIKKENLLKPDFYYCNNFDITRPYPSKFSVSECDKDFCWNNRWRLPFEKNMAGFACVVLVQGYFKKVNNVIYSAKRSVLNQFTRYTSRGIDDNASPANELECELIFCENDQNFVSHCWRRGSVPVRWQTAVSTITVFHQVLENDNTKTHTYFNKLAKRYGVSIIHVLSLLENSGFENELLNSYIKSVEELNFVDIFNLNLNVIINENSIDKAIDFQKNLQFKYLNEKVFTKGKGDKVYENQGFIMRFNCVDSTDRTNIGTFFYARALAEFKGIPTFDKELLIPIFLKSGNVISNFYTLSDATKTQIIRQFTPMNNDERFSKCYPFSMMQSSKSDTALSITRRFKLNVYSAFDNSINEWTTLYKPPLNYTLDWPHLSIISDSKMIQNNLDIIPNSIFLPNSNFFKCEISKYSPEVIIKLPKSMIVTHLTLVILKNSPVSFSLSCGMDNNSRSIWLKDIKLPISMTPISLRYSLPHAKRWNINAPYENHAIEPARFVWISFKFDDSSNATFANIFLDGIITTSYQYQYFKQSTPKNQIIDDYCKKILEFFQTQDKELRNYLSLEIYRIKNDINLNLRNKISIKLNHNPYQIDLNNHLQFSDSKCSFCNKEIKDDEKINTYWIPNFRSILDYDRERAKNSCKKNFQLCCSCWNQIKEKEDQIKELVSIISTKTTVVDKIINYTKTDISGTVIVSNPQSSCFFEYPKEGVGNINSLLLDNDETWSIMHDEQKELFFTLSLTSFSKVSKLYIEFLNELPEDVIWKSQKDLPYSKRFNSNSISFDFQDIYLTDSITFSIITKIGYHLSIRYVKVIGEFIPRAIPSFNNVFSNENQMQMSILKGITNNNERSITFNMPNRNSKISAIGFSIDILQEYQPQSIIVCIYHEGVLQQDIHFLIPQIQSSNNLFFKVPNDPECDTCIVYYIDIMPVFSPYTVLFKIV